MGGSTFPSRYGTIENLVLSFASFGTGHYNSQIQGRSPAAGFGPRFCRRSLRPVSRSSESMKLGAPKGRPLLVDSLIR